jgi:protease-4
MNMLRKLTSLGVLIVMLALVCRPALARDPDQKAPEQKEVKLARITIKGSLPDSLPQVNPFGPSPMYFRKQLELIREAAEDNAVNGIELKVSSPAIGFGKVKELNDTLAEFKESGKKIFGYAESLSMKDLMILSMCDHLAIPESGVVILPGLNAEIMYYKGLFEKLGIKFLVEHIGDYKSAYENYHLPGMSDANRKVLESLLTQYYSYIVETIATNRGLDKQQVIQAIDQAIITPKQAKEFGLVDALCYRDQYEDHLKSVLEVDKIEVDKKYGKEDKDLDMDNPLVLFSQIMTSLSGKKKKESKNPKIALIYASGPINSGKNSVDPFSGESTIGSDTLAEAIKEAGDDDTVKAIVMRVNSPGGSGLASDIIWHAAMNAKAKKPFIISMADVAGSGGYYISMMADLIVAQPNTLTGSIGVVSAMPNLHGSMEKLGINVERIAYGKNSGLMSPFTPPDKVNLKRLTGYMENFYWDFVDKVAQGRKMSRDEVHAIAQGRVWTGTQALENGLVDALGGLSDAMEIAKIKAGLTTEWELKEMPEPPDFFESLSEAMGVRTLLKQVASAAGMNTAESLLLDHPEIKARLERLLNVFRVCRNESLLLLMPMDVQVNF